MHCLSTDATAPPCLLFALMVDAEGHGRLLDADRRLPESVADGFLCASSVLHPDLVIADRERECGGWIEDEPAGRPLCVLAHISF
ncbi:hypothetical protein ASG51_10810 [Methylobacterium sp. Leaf465]|nr:hypothetical protein ASG51_10810 [Methylobacterium sp. Leaf465]